MAMEIRIPASNARPFVIRSDSVDHSKPGTAHDERSRAMIRLLTALTACGALALDIAAAHAGPCSEEIASLQEAAGQLVYNPHAGPSAPQSIGAQLGRQPTPESVRRAHGEAQSRLAAALAHAEALDAEGKQALCMQAVTDAKRLLGLN
jgi:hypothetical protein